MIRKKKIGDNVMLDSKAIPWDDKYLLGIKEVDIQHRKLFDLVNKLYGLDENSTKDELRVILYAFSDYVKTHFKDEEAYMLLIGYPDLKKHKKIHESIVEMLRQLISTPASLEIIKTKMRVVAKRALIDHIANVDMKIKEFVATQDIVEEIFDISDL